MFLNTRGALVDAKSLKESLKKGTELIPLDVNPVDIVWGNDRPPRPKNKIIPLDIKYAGA